MDKSEYKLRAEEIKDLISRGEYAQAAEIADTIDWKKVRNADLLSMVANVYEKNHEYQDAKEILLMAFERAPIGKRLLYKLTDLNAVREEGRSAILCANFPLKWKSMYRLSSITKSLCR